MNKNTETGHLEAQHLLAALRVKNIKDSDKIQKRILYFTVLAAILTILNVLVI